MSLCSGVEYSMGLQPSTCDDSIAKPLTLQLSDCVLQEILTRLTGASDVRAMRLVSRLTCLVVDRCIVALRIRGQVKETRTPYLRHVRRVRVMNSVAASDSLTASENLQGLQRQMPSLSELRVDITDGQLGCIPKLIRVIPSYLGRADFPDASATAVLSAGHGVVLQHLRSISFQKMDSNAVRGLSTFAPNLQQLHVHGNLALAGPAVISGEVMVASDPAVLPHLTHVMCSGSLIMYVTSAATADVCELVEHLKTPTSVLGVRFGPPAKLEQWGRIQRAWAAAGSTVLTGIMPNLQVLTFGYVLCRVRVIGSVCSTITRRWPPYLTGCTKLRAVHSFMRPRRVCDPFGRQPVCMPSLEYFGSAYTGPLVGDELEMLQVAGLKHAGVLSIMDGVPCLPADAMHALWDKAKKQMVHHPHFQSICLPAALLALDASAVALKMFSDDIEEGLWSLAACTNLTRVLFVGTPYLVSDQPGVSEQHISKLASDTRESWSYWRLDEWLGAPVEAVVHEPVVFPESCRTEVLLVQEYRFPAVAADLTAGPQDSSAAAGPADVSGIDNCSTVGYEEVALNQHHATEPVAVVVVSKWVVDAESVAYAESERKIPGGGKRALRAPDEQVVLHIDIADSDDDSAQMGHCEVWGTKVTARAVLQRQGFRLGCTAHWVEAGIMSSMSH